jgi:hypothetical protein
MPIALELEWASPCFTGSLLASAATIVPVGHWNMGPFVTYSHTAARYDHEWKAHRNIPLEQVTFEPFFLIGLSEWADLQLNPAWSWNYREGPARWVLNDFTAKIDIQLYLDQIPHKSWIPSIKFGFQETFPNGKYNNLNRENDYTDQGGSGSWVSTFELAFGKILHIYSDQWVQLRFNIDYGLFTSVHVKGLNSYGGAIGTNGILRPGQKLSFDFSIEYSLTRHIALACDFSGEFQSKSRFTRLSGENMDTTPVVNPLCSSIQYSLAPAIEYNFSHSLGIIVGTWFTLAGKNSSKFSNALIALNYYSE